MAVRNFNGVNYKTQVFKRTSQGHNWWPNRYATSIFTQHKIWLFVGVPPPYRAPMSMLRDGHLPLNAWKRWNRLTIFCHANHFGHILIAEQVVDVWKSSPLFGLVVQEAKLSLSHPFVFKASLSTLSFYHKRFSISHPFVFKAAFYAFLLPKSFPRWWYQMQTTFPLQLVGGGRWHNTKNIY